MQIVHQITQPSAESDKLINLAHIYSSLNRKMMPPVDNQGNAQAFAVNVKQYSGAACTVTYETASNSYVTKQAIKSWYRVWRQKMKDAGVSLKDLGPYGRVFKPRLTASDSVFGSGPEAGRGEWNYSDIVTVPGVSTAVEGLGASFEQNDAADQFTLSLLGSTTTGSSGDESLKFVNVGMIESWLGSRKKYAGADGSDGSSVQEDTVFDDNNPLLLARGGNTASKVMLDEIRDLQKDEPPYTEADFIEPYTQALLKTDANLSNECDLIAPCGLLRVTTTAAVTMIITLVGTGDM